MDRQPFFGVGSEQLESFNAQRPARVDHQRRANSADLLETQLSAQERQRIETAVSILKADLQTMEKKNVIPLADMIEEGVQHSAIAVAQPEDSEVLAMESKISRLAAGSGLSPWEELALYARLKKLVRDYCEYPKPYKIIDVCFVDGGSTNLIHYYADTPLRIPPDDDGFLILPESARSRGDDRWGKPNSWSQERYQHLIQIDMSGKTEAVLAR